MLLISFESHRDQLKPRIKARESLIWQRHVRCLTGFPRIRKKSVKTKILQGSVKVRKFLFGPKVRKKSGNFEKKSQYILKIYEKLEIQTLIYSSLKMNFICNKKYNHWHQGWNSCQISHILTSSSLLFFQFNVEEDIFASFFYFAWKLNKSVLIFGTWMGSRVVLIANAPT